MTPEERLARFLEAGDGEVGADFLTEALAAESTWENPSPDIEDEVVRAIAGEAQTEGRLAVVEPLRSRSRSRLRGWFIGVAGVAAGALLLAVIQVGMRDRGIRVVMAATDLAPAASAVAEIIETRNGVLIRVELSGLQSAPDGFFYQGWVRNGAGEQVSIGTFHMRGGGGRVGLWSGVSLDEYDTISITLQEERAGPASSGQVVLRGSLDT